MFVSLFVCNIMLFITGYINAKPVEIGENVFITDQEFDGQESHPYQVVVKSPAAGLMEVSDDDEYDETAPVPVRVIAVRPQFVNRDRDLSASASDLQAAATGYGHGGHGGHDNAGWLDMGAYSGGYGAFGWYADYPVGGGHGYGR